MREVTAACFEFESPIGYLAEVIFADGPEVPLLGGDVTAGLVRIGDTVRRPRQPQSDLVEALLRYLEMVSFSGAPRFLGTDSQGRQVLTYLAGEVASRPWPDWVADDNRVASVARLVRRFDDAVQGLGIPPVATTARYPEPPDMPPSTAGPPVFVGHMDITPENVVFVAGSASALIDFDLARPTDRIQEVSNMLLWWAPLMPVTDREMAVADVDPFARAALIVNEYGLEDEDRRRVVDTARNSAHRAWYSMRTRAQRLGGGWARMWDEGVGDRIRRRQVWLADNAAALGAAVSGR